MKKHEEYRKNAANGIVNLRNFEFIEEDFSFKLVFLIYIFILIEK